MSLIDIILALQSEPSTNKRIAILQENKENKELQFFFKNCLDPQEKFYIKRYIGKFNPELPDGFSPESRDCLKKLSSREVTGKAAKELVEKAFSTLNRDYAELFERILLKDAKCGVTITTAKKIFPDMFPEAVKLCKAFSYSPEAVKENIQFPAYSQEKLDGARCLAFITKNGVILNSSGTKTFKGLTKIENFAAKHFPVGTVIDGELLFFENEDTPLERKISNGLANKSVAGTISPVEANKANFIVWDILTEKEYTTEKTRPYNERLDELATIIMRASTGYLPGENLPIRLVSSVIVSSLDEALKHFRFLINKGSEGTILKNKMFQWKGKRIKDCQKFKLELSTTLKVKEVQPGKKGTKFEHLVGALLCTTEDGLVEVGVGSGLSESDREHFNTQEMIGKCIEVTHNGLIERDGKYSLFLPRYTGIRFDKEKADTLEVIKANSLSTSQLS